MKALVLYESIFGNTKDVAEAVARGLESRFEVELVEVSEPHSDLEDADLLVIGGPTHAFGMTRESSRADGLKKASERGIEPVSKAGGIRDLLEGFDDGGHHPLVATFDTAIKKRWLPSGSAAKSASNALKKKGFETVIEPEQFKVAGTDGPLKPGELERAEEWGKTLAGIAAEQLSTQSAVGTG